MKHQLKNGNGSALLIAVAVLMIFTILGLSLLTLTSNGLANNENRENIVQATDLADKGTEYAVNDIQKTLEDEIVNNPMGKTDFGIFLGNTLNNSVLQCPTNIQNLTDAIGYKILADNTSYTRVCIENVKKVSEEEKDAYKRIVTFKSIGYVNGQEKTTSTEVIIGTDTIPDQLKYAVSSNNKGNVFLHGGVEIQGDIKTDGNLIVAKQASIGEGTYSWVNSVRARLIRNPDSVTPKIILSEDSNKDIYFLNKSNVSYSTHINISDSNLKSSSNYIKYNNNAPIVKDPSKYENNQNRFFYSNNITIHRKNLPQDSINVTNLITDNYNKNGVTQYKNNQSFTDLWSYNNSNLSKAQKDDKFYFGDFEKYCSNTRGPCIEQTRYINKNLTFKLNNKSSSNSAKIKGIYYIYGNLTIEDSFLESDAIFYVNGDVTITDSKLHSLDKKGTLIIFANGKIKLTNISQYLRDPSKIQAFLYSKEELRIYGSGSNIEITGGISGNKVILSGLRGITTSSSNYASLSSQLAHSTDTKGNLIPATNSRLKIIYDQNLIDNYTSFKRDDKEEFITQINEPEFISRE